MTAAAIRDPDAMPTFDLAQRDDMGRLVGVTWHAAGAASGEKGRTRWLVAVDGSACSLRAVVMAVDLAVRENGDEIDLVHVHPWLNKEAAETELPRCGWAATSQARQLLDTASVRWHLYVVMGEGAPEIVAKANALGSRGIAIGRRGLSVTESLLLGSVAYKVVHLAKLPVLIVR